MEFSEKEVKLTFLFSFLQQIICSRRCTEEEKHPWSRKGGMEWGMASIVCSQGGSLLCPQSKGICAKPKDAGRREPLEHRGAFC